MQSFFMLTMKTQMDCADAQADLSLCWSHMSECPFSHVPAMICNIPVTVIEPYVTSEILGQSALPFSCVSYTNTTQLAVFINL